MACFSASPRKIAPFKTMIRALKSIDYDDDHDDDDDDEDDV